MIKVSAVTLAASSIDIALLSYGMCNVGQS